MRFSRTCVFLALIVSGCSSVPSSKDTPLIDNLPGIEQLADSLNRTGAHAVKWAIHNEQVVYSSPDSMDWKKEFQAFINNNVNYLRYRDAYTVSDTTIGSERTVRFEAKSSSQEIRLLEIRLRKNRITHVVMEKDRKNLFSSTHQRFEFSETHYQLELEQTIKGLLASRQYAYGTIVNQGELWRGTFDLGDCMMPIQFILDTKAEAMSTLYVKNGEELIGFNQISTDGDSLIFGSDYFNSRFKFRFTSDSSLAGVWINAKREHEKSLQFTAQRGVPYRFPVDSIPNVNLTGIHAAVFYDAAGGVDDSTLLQLDQRKHQVTGSFLTETGDYRYLDGVVRNDSLFLSSMDGTHAYYFEAAIKDGKLDGSFRSGKHWKQPWVAYQYENFELRDPESITTLNAGAAFDFSFPNEKGKTVSLSDPAFENKPIVVSIMGTWCSNCLDESVFLKELYESYHSRGLEVIALDFELVNDTARAIQNIDRYKQSLGIDYPVLLASLGATKTKAAEALPSLNGVFSYPTMIVLDRDHKVVKIHTGFSGPATGLKYYDRFRLQYLQLIDSVVQEGQAL